MAIKERWAHGFCKFHGTPSDVVTRRITETCKNWQGAVAAQSGGVEDCAEETDECIVVLEATAVHSSAMAANIERALRRLSLGWGPLDNLASPSRSAEGRVHARSWVRSVRRRKEEVFQMTEAEAATISSLRLLESMPTDIAVCDMKNARTVLQQRNKSGGQDAVPTLKVWHSSKEKLPTLVASRILIVAERAEGTIALRRMQPCEAAVLMGVERDNRAKRKAWESALRRMGPRKMWECVTDAVDRHFADMLCGNLEQMLGGPPSGADGVVRYGALYAGGLDTMFQAVRRRWPAARYIVAAEKEKERWGYLKEAYQVETCVQEAKGATRGKQLTLLVVTPPCKPVSAAAIVQPERRLEQKRKAKEAMSEVLEAIVEAARESRPRAMLMEEVTGMFSHYKEVWEAVVTQLGSRLPEATWRHGAVDAATLGAPHSRKRLGWVATFTWGMV